MKKIHLITLLLTSMAIFGQAPRGFYATAGVSQSNLNSSDLVSTPGIGYKLGINFNMGYHENFNYQIEILFNHKVLNFKTIGSRTGTLGEEKYLSESLDVGFYYNYYILKPQEDKFFFGPQIGIASSIAGQFSKESAFKGVLDFSNSDGMSQEEILASIENGTYNDESYYLLPYSISGDKFSNTPKINFDAGLGLSGGYNNFRFDLRYTKGLNNRLAGLETNSYDSNNRYNGPELKGKLNTISLSISYLMFKKNKNK